MITTTERTTLDDVVELLAGKGYRLQGKLGEGCTREVYQVDYSSGSLQKSRVAKIPKTDIHSATAQIILSKGDIDDREVLVLNKVRHPNIVEVYDAFKIGGRTITIEEHFDAVSLEDLVRMNQPITDPNRFREIFLQIISGLKHLHRDERIYHRDIKPSNILVGKGGVVKISDLQNAGRINDIKDSSVPTRGGTAFTHPDLLNALVQGDSASASLRTEFYSLGTTMYYVLTGKRLADISLEEDPEGKIIDLGNRTIKVALKSDGLIVKGIDKGEHEKRIRSALAKVPKPYRNMIERCLIDDDKNYASSYCSHEILAEDLRDATAPRRFIDLGKIRRRAQAYLITASVIAGTIAGCHGMNLLDNVEKLKEPSITRMLEGSSFADSTYSALLDEEDSFSFQKLFPQFEDIRKHVKDISEYDAFISTNSEMHHVSKRLTYSLIRAAQMEDTEQVHKNYGRSRLEGSLVPRSFMLGSFSEDELEKDVAAFQIMNGGIRYLKRCVSASALDYGKPTAADVFANYFSDQATLFRAKKEADGLCYFSSEQHYGKKKGYGWYLPEGEQRLIDRAVALYAITDNAGNLHLEMLDSNNKPIKSQKEAGQ